MARFSLAPPTVGNSSKKSVDILGFPDIEAIKEFASGNLGLSGDCFDGFFSKSMAGLSGETAEIFSKLAQANVSGSFGLPALESVIIKSIFETQKPYIDTAICTMEGLVVVEDIISVLLAGKEHESLKPKTNDKSLHTKLNNLKGDMDELKKTTQPAPNTYSNIDEKDRTNGLSYDEMDRAFSKKDITISENTVGDFDWMTVSTYYSTGQFIEGIPYKYTYHDITDHKLTSKPVTETPQILEDDNNPTIIFDVWVDRLGDGKNIERITDISLLPNDWDIKEKWVGQWTGWSKNESTFKNQYLKYINEILDDNFKKRKVTDEDTKNEIRKIVEDSMPFDSGDNFHRDFMKGSISNQTYEYTKTIGDTSMKSFGNKLNGNPTFGYMPRKIDGKWINPETDFYLQLIKISPTGENVPNNNSQLSGDRPLVKNYSGEKIEDVLLKKDYSVKETGDPANFYVDTDSQKISIHRKSRKNNSIKTNRESIPEPNNRYGVYNKAKDFNYITNFRDMGIFYVVEGIYKNRKDVEAQNKNIELEDESWYRYGSSETRPGLSLAAATSKFVEYAATSLPCILSTAALLLKTFNAPFNLIFEILMENLGDGFAAFSPEIVAKFAELRGISGIAAKKLFINSDLDLKNLISIDLKGNYRFILDGAGMIALFGHNFGIGLKNALPNMVLEPNGLPSLGCDEKPPDRGEDISGVDINNPLSGTENATPQSNRLVSDTEYRVVNIEYSTGDFIEGINYKYYYITLDNEALINRATADIEKANQLNDKAESIRLKLQAMENIQKAQVKDPGNRYLNDQMNELQKEEGVQTNIMIQFMINLIVMPLKTIICVVDYILDFFRNTKIIELPTAIPEFLKFEWILEFFSPSKIMDLIGLKINPAKLAEFVTQSINISPNFLFDVSQVLSGPLLGKLPAFSGLQFPEIIKGGSKILLTMGGLFCFLEGLINAVMCFLFNVFNIDKAFACPEINMSRFTDETLSQEDIDKLLAEADFNFRNQNSNNKFNNSQINQNAFLYDITLDDGTKVQGLDRTELDAFVASNQNLKYKYNFNNG